MTPLSLLAEPTPVAPVMTPEALQALSQHILSLTTAETTNVTIDHFAIGATRIMQGHVQLNDSGDTLRIDITTQFGQQVGVNLSMNQTDEASLRAAVTYLERVAKTLPGDPVETELPIPPRTYVPNTSTHASTIAAFSEGRHDVVPALIEPVVTAGLRASGFIGVLVRTRGYADKQGRLTAGQETDSELVVTAWNPDGKGSGWAGQAARDWTRIHPAEIAADAVRITKLSANPVAFEPGRHVAILDRPAMAQIVAGMGWAFDAATTLGGSSPLFDAQTRRPRLGLRIMDPRVSLSSDPRDPDGGYLPFNWEAYPLVPMTWVDHGVLKHLAYQTRFAAARGIVPANDPPSSIRMANVGATVTSVEEMIATCKTGIYVRRFSQVMNVDAKSGTMTGLTNGGCFLVRNGKIDKAIKDLRFQESPWLFLNRLLAIGSSERTALGYAPWHGGWPIAPTIVPPIMVQDFNFTALAGAV